MSRLQLSPTTAPPPVPVEIEAPVERGFFFRAARSFAYPLRNGGWYRWLAGSVIIWFGIQASKFGMRSVILCGPIVGYLATYLLHIANESGDGKDEIPDWPSFNVELVSNATMFSLTVLLCYAPVGLYLAAMYYWDWPFRYLVIPLAISFFIQPMAVLRVSMLQTLESLNPFHLAVSIFCMPTAYMGLCLILTFMSATKNLINFGFHLIPYAGSFFSACLTFYVLILYMRILGLFYYVHRERLSWFTDITIEKLDTPATPELPNL